MELCPIFVLVSHVGQWRGTEDEFNGRNMLIASHLLLSFLFNNLSVFGVLSFEHARHDKVTNNTQYLTLYGSSVRLMSSECWLGGKLDNLRNLGRLFIIYVRFRKPKLLANGAHLRVVPNLTLI